MRRSAKILKVNRRTVEKKLPYLGKVCALKNQKFLESQKNLVSKAQVDDLITKENSKLKPLSVSFAVNEKTRHILAVEVARIPAFGHLAKIAVKKYGKRKDEHKKSFLSLLQRIAPAITEDAVIKSDKHKTYHPLIAKNLPGRTHETYKGERGCVAGQGELKKVKFDPIFAANHACAMFRANVNRLIRKTWCTTKVPQRLRDHLEIFILIRFYFIKSSTIKLRQFKGLTNNKHAQENLGHVCYL